MLEVQSVNNKQVSQVDGLVDKHLIANKFADYLASICSNFSNEHDAQLREQYTLLTKKKRHPFYFSNNSCF
jgi:hypothetical protein